MTGDFFQVLNAVFVSLGGGLGFLICLGLIVFAFIGGLVIVLTCEIKTNRRFWFLYFCSGVCVSELSVDLISANNPFFSVFNLGVALSLFSVFKVCPEKNRKITEPQRELVRYIDNKVKPRRTLEKISVNPIAETDDKTNGKDMGIDFSHVKSVLERINACGLSSPDKRLIHDLETSLSEAENGDRSSEIKEKINDGLGALLKIMSKYGV